MISEVEIQEAVQKLVEVYQPKVIYLFGSYAWGEPTEDSDLDFLLVLQDGKKIDHLLRMKAWQALRTSNFSKDLLFNNHREFQRRAEHLSSLEHKIKSDGRILYETY